MPVTLRLSGSTAAVPLIDALRPAFQARHPAVRLVADSPVGEMHNATQVQAQVAGGTLALAIISGSPSDDLWAAPLAVDALAVIVHADSPLASLTLAQLQQVFSGRTWRWSELGIADDAQVGAEIVVVSREPGSGTRAAFEDLALRERLDQDPSPVTTMAVLRLSSAAVVAYVAEHPAAIGYVALGALAASSEGASVKPLAIEGVPPGPEQVSSGAYRLSLPFHLVARKEPTGAGRQFLDFCLSPAGQRIVSQQYVSVLQ